MLLRAFGAQFFLRGRFSCVFFFAACAGFDGAILFGDSAISA